MTLSDASIRSIKAAAHVKGLRPKPARGKPGETRCPNCGGDLIYYVEDNGHVRAYCRTTLGCVSFVE